MAKKTIRVRISRRRVIRVIRRVDRRDQEDNRQSLA